MKYLTLTVFLIFSMYVCDGQNGKVLYCNSDSVHKWIKNGKLGSMSLMWPTYVSANGKTYEDTSCSPPLSRLTKIGDTVVSDTSITYTDVALKVSSCGKCEIKVILAYKRTIGIGIFREPLYKDKGTGKHFCPLGGDTNNFHDEIDYVGRDKKPFKNLLIWPNN